MEQLKLTISSQASHEGCPHEMATVDMNGKGNIKSLCDRTCDTTGHPTWTNCHVWGSCTMAGDLHAKG